MSFSRHDDDDDRLEQRLPAEDWSPVELRRWVRLIRLLANRPPPPDPYGLYPRYSELKSALIDALATLDGERIEETFLLLYSHVHGYDVPLTAAERRQFVAADGYLSHIGGISPILKAGPFIGPETISADFGAGNGLQGLLLQVLYPHQKTIQVEISSRMVESGRHLQAWLGIADERVDWIVGDVSEISPRDVDFVYLYRPVRPAGAGRTFYERFAAELDRSDRSPIIFSIADCLGDFLSPRFEVFYTDGHLTCFRRRKKEH